MKLCIISLKKFFLNNGCYFTYGGFGDYVKSFLPYFDEIHLCVPVSRIHMPGVYPMDHPKFVFTNLPFYRNELELVLKWPAIFWSMKNAVKNADVVNPRIPDMTGVAGWLWCMAFGKPHFVSVQSDMHGFMESPNNTNTRGLVREGLYAWIRFYLLFERMIFRKSLCFPQGSLLRSRYPSAAAAYEWISSSIHQGDIIEPFESEKCKRKIVNLLHVGRVTKSKGHIYLIRTLACLKELMPERSFQLRCVGKVDKQSLAMLQDEAERVGVDRQISWIGNIEHGEALWGFFDSADIFVLSSIWEGTPKVLLEAMARCVPVVSTDVGGVPTLVDDGARGLLVPPHDPEAMARAIARMITDDSLRNRCIKNGNRFARQYIVEAQARFIIEKLVEYYPSLPFRRR